MFILGHALFLYMKAIFKSCLFKNPVIKYSIKLSSGCKPGKLACKGVQIILGGYHEQERD